MKRNYFYLLTGEYSIKKILASQKTKAPLKPCLISKCCTCIPTKYLKPVDWPKFYFSIKSPLETESTSEAKRVSLKKV